MLFGDGGKESRRSGPRVASSSSGPAIKLLTFRPAAAAPQTGALVGSIKPGATGPTASVVRLFNNHSAVPGSQRPASTAQNEIIVNFVRRGPLNESCRYKQEARDQFGTGPTWPNETRQSLPSIRSAGNPEQRREKRWRENLRREKTAVSDGRSSA